MTLTEEMIQQFTVVFGKQYHLPPTFPMIFYRYIEVPWEDPAAPILRKQKCTCSQGLVVGETYQCQVTVEQERQKGNTIFYTQSLTGYDEQGKECFRCVSELVTSSLSQKKR